MNVLIMARLKKGLSQREVAKKLDVSARFISAMELGQAWVPKRRAKKLARILDLTEDELALMCSWDS